MRTILLDVNSSGYRCLHESIHIAHLIAFILQEALDGICPRLGVLVHLLLILVLVLVAVVEHVLIEILKLPIVDDLCLLLVEVIVYFAGHYFFQQLFL